MKKFILGLCFLGVTGYIAFTQFVLIEYKTTVQSYSHRSRSISSDSTAGILNQIRSLPYGDRVVEFLSAIGYLPTAQNGNANDGHIRYNQKLISSSSCFANLASRFYADVKSQDLNFFVENMNIFKNPLKGRPSLQDQTGQGIYKNFQPGWLWALAQQYAGGNKNLAIKLIGLCSHDDTNQKISFQSDRSSVFTKLFESASKFKTAVASFDLNEIDKFELKYAIGENAQEIIKDCPMPQSLMYVSKSLGNNFDISQEMKDKLTNVQAPTMGASVLPSKYYHIIGGAMTRCMADEIGVPGFILDRFDNTLINSYRSQRLCVRSEKLISSLDYDHYKNTNLEQLINIFRTSQDQKKFDEPYKTIAGYCLKKDITDPAILKKCVQQYLNQLDTAYLLNSFDSAIVSECNFIDLKNEYKNKLSSVTKRSCPEFWSPERCKSSLNRVQTWIMDFEWSEAAHNAGKSFAEASCLKENMKPDLQSLSCDQIKKMNNK